jgi:hypothetical protein
VDSRGQSWIWVVKGSVRAPGSADAFEVEKGLSVRTASLDDLIRMKEAADRMKDQRSP